MSPSACTFVPGRAFHCCRGDDFNTSLIRGWAPPDKTSKNQKTRDDLELNAIQLIQANVCTLHPGELKHAKTKQNCGSTARMIFLDNAFTEAGVHVACIQEARVPCDGVHSCQNFRMYRSSADDDGSYGVQVWILHKFAHMVTAVNPISPRILHVVIQIGPIFLHIISAHAPIEAATEVCKEAFWSSLRLVVSTIGSPEVNMVMIGIDANARVGELQCDWIGGVAPEAENNNGARLREFLCEVELVAVNTFHDAGTTWTSTYGTKTRIDYVLTTQKLATLVSRCTTCTDIDLATAVKDDHTALATDFNNVSSLLVEMAAKIGRTNAFVRSRQQQPRKYTPESMKNPNNRWYFQHAVATAWQYSKVRRRAASAQQQQQDWVRNPNTLGRTELNPSAYSVEADVKLLVNAVRDAADKFFDAQATAPRKPWLSQRTWEIVSFAKKCAQCAEGCCVPRGPICLASRFGFGLVASPTLRSVVLHMWLFVGWCRLATSMIPFVPRLIGGSHCLSATSGWPAKSALNTWCATKLRRSKMLRQMLRTRPTPTIRKSCSQLFVDSPAYRCGR